MGTSLTLADPGIDPVTGKPKATVPVKAQSPTLSLAAGAGGAGGGSNPDVPSLPATGSDTVPTVIDWSTPADQGGPGSAAFASNPASLLNAPPPPGALPYNQYAGHSGAPSAPMTAPPATPALSLASPVSAAPGTPAATPAVPAGTPQTDKLALAEAQFSGTPAPAATPSATPAAPDRLSLAKAANDIYAQSTERQFQGDLRGAEQLAFGKGQGGSGMLRGKLGDVALTHSSNIAADLSSRLNAAETGQIADQQQAFENQIATSNLTLAQKTEALNEAVQTGQLTLAQKNEALNELQNSQQFGLAGQQLALAQKSEADTSANQQAQTAAQTALGQGQLALAASGQKQAADQFQQSLAQSASQFGQNLTLQQQQQAATQAYQTAQQQIERDAQTQSAAQFQQNYGLSVEQFHAQQNNSNVANFIAYLNSGGTPQQWDFAAGKPFAASTGNAQSQGGATTPAWLQNELAQGTINQQQFEQIKKDNGWG